VLAKLRTHYHRRQMAEATDFPPYMVSSPAIGHLGAVA